jgi:hypothetical protein
VTEISWTRNTNIILLTADACIPINGCIANQTRIQQQCLDEEFRHSVIVLGAGILLGLVAVVLRHCVMEHLNHSPCTLALMLVAALVLPCLAWFLSCIKPEFTYHIGIPSVTLC